MTARRTTRQRSTPEKRPAPGHGYPPKVKAKALKLIESERDLAAAHKATGVPRPTLSRWAKAAGIDLAEAARSRTANATEAVREAVTRARLTTVQLLEAHIEDTGRQLATVARVNADAAELIAALDPDLIEERATIAGPVYIPTDPTAHAAKKRAHAVAGLPLAPRDAEGILTRAIHDLQLLKGEATERGELVVEFGVPRPNPAATRVVDEDDLGEQP